MKTFLEQLKDLLSSDELISKQLTYKIVIEHDNVTFALTGFVHESKQTLLDAIKQYEKKDGHITITIYVNPSIEDVRWYDK